MSQTIYVIFPDYTHAERAVAALLDSGVAQYDVSIVANHPDYENNYDDTLLLSSAGDAITAPTPGDPGKGFVEGAGIGLGVGILAGLVSLVVPGVGLVLGAGALASAIGIAGVTTVGGAVVGAVTGSLIDMGVPADAAQAYADRLQAGGALVAVTLPSGDVDVAIAHDILSKYDGTDISAY